MSRRVYVVVAALVLVVVVAMVVTYATGLIGFCPPARPEACIEVYDPVYDIPTFRSHANSCFACSEGAWIWFKLVYAGLALISGIVLITTSIRN